MYTLRAQLVSLSTKHENEMRDKGTKIQSLETSLAAEMTTNQELRHQVTAAQQERDSLVDEVTRLSTGTELKSNDSVKVSVSSFAVGDVALFMPAR